VTHTVVIALALGGPGVLGSITGPYHYSTECQP